MKLKDMPSNLGPIILLPFCIVRRIGDILDAEKPPPIEAAYQKYVFAEDVFATEHVFPTKMSIE